MKVLGIDPGIERTGYAIIDVQGHDLQAREYGCITTSSKLSLSQRLVELHKDLVELLEHHRPEAAVIERLVFVHNATSAIAVGQARGVLLMTLQQHNIEVREYSPSEVKQAVTRNGAAGQRVGGTSGKANFWFTGGPQA